MKRIKPRARGSDSTEESLRGKNRELQKIIKKLQQRIAHLEKQLKFSDSTLSQRQPEQKKTKKEIIMCEQCGKGEMEEFVLDRPDKKICFLVCRVCKFRKKAK